MKKLIAAIVIASIGASFASTVVYDYKASIKRLDLNMKKASYKINNVKRTGILQSFSVKSDTIQGYVQLQRCESCAGTAEYSASGELNEDAYAYLTLKGDKYSKLIQRPEYLYVEVPSVEDNYTDEQWEAMSDAEKEAAAAAFKPEYTKNTLRANSGDYLYVLKTPIEARSAMFGASQALKMDDGGYIINPKQNNKAWLALDFYMPALGAIGAGVYADGEDAEGSALADVETAGRLFKGNADPNGLSLAYLGFLGFGNYGFGSDIVDEVPTLIQNAGFGTVKNLSKTESSEYICIDDWSETTSCYIINSISGTLVGYPNYDGICNFVPMWDFCYGVEVPDAVICGSWTLKYNAKLSDAADQEAEILKKLVKSGSAKYMYEIDEAGYLVTPDETDNEELYHEEEEEEPEPAPAP